MDFAFAALVIAGAAYFLSYPSATRAAGCIAWMYFLLIPTKIVEFSAMHGGSIRPFHVYALIILAGALTIARHVRLSDASMSERVFIGLCTLLIGWMFVSPGGRLDFEYNLVLWPLANLAMGTVLFYFARSMCLGSTIRAAAAGALIIALGGIYADLWFPGLLAEWEPRPAGFPQNSNNGALLVVMLLALLLPARLYEAPSRIVLCAMVASAPLVLATLSKSGWLLYGVVFFICAGSLFYSPVVRWPSKRFMAAFAAVFLVTASFAPALHEPWGIAAWHSRIGVSVADIWPKWPSATTLSPIPDIGQEHPSSPPASQGPPQITQDEWDRSIKQSNDTTEKRTEAARYFFGAWLERPFVGHGTGFGYKFKVPPHNTFIALLAEQGLPAALLYIAALVLLLGIAVRRKSPILLAIAAVAGADSLASHTVLIEPLFLVFAGAALGCAGPPEPELLYQPAGLSP